MNCPYIYGLNTKAVNQARQSFSKYYNHPSIECIVKCRCWCRWTWSYRCWQWLFWWCRLWGWLDTFGLLVQDGPVITMRVCLPRSTKSEAKAGRPLRHGHRRRVPIAVAQSEIKGQGKEWLPAKHKSAEQFPNIKVRSRIRRRAHSFTYHCAISSHRTSAGYHCHRRIRAVSLSTTNRPIAGNAELLRKYRNLP